MTVEEIKLLDNQIISDEQFEEIELNEHVIAMENWGDSSQYTGKTWFDVQFDDETSIDVFC